MTIVFVLRGVTIHTKHILRRPLNAVINQNATDALKLYILFYIIYDYDDDDE